MSRPIPDHWLPKCRMDGVNWHWTAGTNFPNPTDLRAYHLLIDGEGKWHRGIASIDKNSGSLKPGYAAHTLNCNTNRIGISLCGMGGAVESPLSFGKWPLKPVQFDSLVEGVRQINEFYNIDCTRRLNLSHAEVEITLGIKQRNKWDWTRLPEDVTKLRGAIAIGDWLRERISKGDQPAMKDGLPIPEGATARVETKGANLNTRAAPEGTVNGSLPNGSIVTVEDEQGPWLQVRTQTNQLVWVSRQFMQVIDGPRPLMPTTPDPSRDLIAELQAVLDKYKAQL